MNIAGHRESPCHETTQLFGSIIIKEALPVIPVRQEKVLVNGGFGGSDWSNPTPIVAETY